MLGKHSSSKQGHGKVLSCSHGLSCHIGEKQCCMRKEVWRGKELVESIFIKVEPGIAVLGSCCVSSAWSSHIKLCLVCIRAAQDRGTRGSPCVWDPQAHPPALQCHGCHPSSHVTAWAPPSPSFQQLSPYLRCRGGKLIPKMAIQG